MSQDLGYIKSGKAFTTVVADVVESSVISAPSLSILNDDITLTANDSGSTMGIEQTAGGYIITLPPVEAGLAFKFIVTLQAAGSTIINADPNLSLSGTIISDVIPASVVGVSTISINGGQSVVGTLIELNGISSTQWSVSIICQDIAGITVA